MWKKFSLLSVQLDRLAWSSQQQKKKTLPPGPDSRGLTWETIFDL